MATWLRPTGSELETNDAPETIKRCEDLGWERIDEEDIEEDIEEDN